MKMFGNTFPRELFGPTCQKRGIVIAKVTFSITPRNHLDNNTFTLRTTDPPHGIAKEYSKAPQRNKLKQPLRQGIISRRWCLTVILLIGAFFITFFGLQQLGGWGELQAFCASKEMQYALWRPMSDPDFPWLGVMIASITIGIWYWCTDQYIVQRTLSAKDLKTARRGAIFGGFLKVWPVLIFLVPGMIGAALHHKGILLLPVAENGVIKGDQVFPTMVAQLLPVGLRGLVVGGVLAALMSSLSSLFNSSASLFTVDIYEKIRPGRSQKEYVQVGRIATAVVVVLGMLWIPVMKIISSGGLYLYLQSVQGYIAPAIAAVFLLGLFCKRINAAGAVWGLAGGFTLGMFKLTCQTFFGAAKLQNPAVLAWIGDFNAMYASGWLLAISAAIIVVVSLMTAPPPPEKLQGLTYSCLDRAAIRASWNWRDAAATVIVSGLVIALYLYFSFWV